ncbi:hypothetical protein PVK06_029018 [Gossypium arboreum]|uniref:Uncharacterized protein n=1 Tax=Gossypium arboreum TaxID=29729 RepID=A0ABR0P5E6_GOSAR|nr:hypothetical protein PVK06_029018 [Gossypium arboreum]
MKLRIDSAADDISAKKKERNSLGAIPPELYRFSHTRFVTSKEELGKATTTGQYVSRDRDIDTSKLSHDKEGKKMGLAARIYIRERATLIQRLIGELFPHAPYFYV